MIFRVILAALLGGAIVSTAISQDRTAGTDSLTLRQAVDLSIAAHPLLHAADSQIQAADARLGQSRGLRLPELRASETLTHSNNPVFVFGSLLEQSRFGANNFELSSLNDPAALQNFRGVLSSRVSVFDGHQTTSRIAQAEAGRQSAVENRASIEQRIRFDTLRSYYGLVLARSGRDVATQATRTAEADVELARNRRDAGLAVDSDLLAAQVQLADFRRRQIEAEGQAALAESELNILMGRPSGNPIPLPTTNAPREFAAPTEDDLLLTALTHRPDYAASKSQVRSAQLAVQERSGDRLPHVDAFANIGVSGRSPVTGNSDYTVGASLTFNIFDAGRNARIAEARYQESAAAAQHEDATRQLRIDVLRARQQWLTAGEQLRVARATVDQAAEVLRITENRYEAGLEAITALLRAQTDLVRSRMNLIASENEYTIGYASLLLVTGTLTDTIPFTSDEVQR